MILEGDCVEKMRELDECSVDAIVTDPPYGLEFMGKEWDSPSRMPGALDRFRLGAEGGAKSEGYRQMQGKMREFQRWSEVWATEALRVLKPGGHLLAFGGTRTYHRLACAVEDAGFEIRDSLIWLYGSGFPKSLDVSKAIDRAAGAEREVVGSRRTRDFRDAGERSKAVHGIDKIAPGTGSATTDVDLTVPATPEAARWQGWGTALKPSHEPIVVARKPLVGTVAANVLEHGTGTLNVDGCRVEGGSYSYPNGPKGNVQTPETIYGERATRRNEEPVESHPAGRWPSNVALSHLPECVEVGVRKVKGDYARGGNQTVSHFGGKAKPHPDVGYVDEDGTETIPAYECAPGCPVAALDEQSGETTRGHFPSHKKTLGDGEKYGTARPWDQPERFMGDTGGASRFFYTAKASRAERNAGLDGFEAKIDTAHRRTNLETADRPHLRGQTARQNSHPTVKPIDLMRWLVRLVTPPGGIVLDPFTGSGTTGIAAVLEGFDFIGIEREAEYVEIAKARIAWWAKQQGTTEEILVRAGLSERIQREHEERGQLGLIP